MCTRKQTSTTVLRESCMSNAYITLGTIIIQESEVEEITVVFELFSVYNADHEAVEDVDC